MWEQNAMRDNKVIRKGDWIELKKCTWKKYTASVLVAAMLAAQPMAVYADEASTASQAAYSDTEAKDINGVY